MEPHRSDGNGHHLDPEELVEKVFEAEDVRSVLSALPERHRTALVLREFEGYSHRQIASMLDTSPQRVKALIHRAKAGFRRAWTDDHHPGQLAAFAPLLTPINWMRRFLGRAPEFDSSTTAATTVAASPAAQTLVTIAAERASVLATVMLAGTMGLAIQNVPQQESRAQEEQPIVVEAAEGVVEPRDAKPEAKPKEKPERAKPEPAPSPTVEPSPAAEEVEEVVLEESEEAGKPEVVDGPSPEPPAHPAGFTYSFTSDRTADEPCGCGGAPQLVQKNIAVSQEGMAAYDGSLSDAISDATGKSAWPVQIDLRTDSESIHMYFEVRDGRGASPYDASGVRGTTNAEPWGGWTYTYTGTYQRRAGPGEHSDAPHRGTFTAALTFSWAEQRLVSATFGLNEAG